MGATYSTVPPSSISDSAAARYPADLPEAARVAMITLRPSLACAAAAAWCVHGAVTPDRGQRGDYLGAD